MHGDEFKIGLPHVVAPAELAPRATCYTLAPPSPPSIHIPHLPDDEGLVLPAYKGVDGEDLTQEDLKTITQIHHVARDQTRNWKYELRREAQLILPFLYLGPSLAARDINFLQAEGITMLLVIRDTKSAQARLLSGARVAKELGIESTAVDVSGSQELIAAFPRAIKIINEHFLSIFREQSVKRIGGDDDETITINQTTFKRGKVLVFCESGNERSASVVVAYIMAVYGADLVAAIQFVQSQRFCIALDDQMKSLLLAFQDILVAKRDIQKAKSADLQPTEATMGRKTLDFGSRNGKRRIDEINDEDMEVDGSREMDDGRFEGREPFMPFIDRD